MRLFVGMPVPGHEALSALGPELRALGARPVPPGTWHVTLRFLGEADPGPVQAALALALDGTEAVPCQVQALGAFDRPEAARILWAGVKAPGLEEVARNVVEATRDLGVPPDPRPLHPHVTLARCRSPVDARALLERHLETTFGKGTLATVVLYTSTLGPTGPRYDAVASWHLA